MTELPHGEALPTTDGIGRRLAELRVQRALRVSELARRVQVSPSLISQIERGQSGLSVQTLFSLARALDVPVDSFFRGDGGDDAAEADTRAVDEAAAALAAAPAVAPAAPPAVPLAGWPGDAPAPLRLADGGIEPAVVRPSARATIDIRGGVRWERLTPTALDGIEFLELVYEPGAESDAQLYRHPGVELVLVTAGTMHITVGFRTHVLGARDSIAFPSSTPHRYVNPTAGETRAITVILRDELSTLSVRTAPGAGF